MQQLNTPPEEELCFSFEGNVSKLKSELLKWATTQSLLPPDADETAIKALLSELSKPEFPSEGDERFEKVKSGRRGFAGGSYHISVKASTIVIALSLAGVFVPPAFIALVLAIKQVDVMGKAVVRLDEYEGEMCMANEIWLKRRKLQHGFDSSFFANGNCECINNHISGCKYKDGDRCSVTPPQIGAILETMVAKCILLKERGEYFYRF
ncbi:MAG: hypothetical protein FWC70_01575 [Defluviitaleaceae bacterium]|nr:hypothetical protein [Defluviitaleaceae bacterium]